VAILGNFTPFEISLLEHQDKFVNPEKHLGYMPKYTALFGGFGNGKTSAAIVRAMKESAIPHNLGVVARQELDDLEKSVLMDFFEMMPSLETGYNKNKHVLTLPNGSKIMFVGLKDLKIAKNINLGWFWLEQAEEIEPGGHDWIWELFVKPHLPENQDDDGKAKDFYMIEAPTKSNPHLPEDYEENLKSIYTDVWYKRFVEGSWDVFEGQIFKMWSRNIHAIRPFEIPEGWPIYESIDHGVTNPTSVHWYTLDWDGFVYAIAEYYKGNALISEHVKNIRAMRKWIAANLITPRSEYLKVKATYIDPACEAKTMQKGNIKYSVIDEYRQHNLDIRGVLKPEEIMYIQPAPREGLNAGLLRLGEYLAIDDRLINPITKKMGSPRAFVTTNCPMLIDEIPKQRWVQGTISKYTGKNQQEKPLDADNHAVDDMKYFILTRPTPNKIKKVNKREEKHTAFMNALKAEEQKAKEYQKSMRIHARSY
jgi:phage terminase large subunit